MSEKKFILNYKEYLLTPRVEAALERLRDGKTVRKDRFTPKELNDIGLCYWYGHIVPLDYKKALSWYKASAAFKHKGAVFNMYVCYFNGTGVKINRETAMYWLKRAAKLDNASAQYNLAEMYYVGGLLRKNRRCARNWFDKAEKNAMKGNDSVILNCLAVSYLHGDSGFERNMDKAVSLFEMAAEKQFPLSILWLVLIAKNRKDRANFDYWVDEYNKCPYKVTDMVVSDVLTWE